MKKLVFAIGCIAAVASMTSCTTDNIEEPKRMTTKNNYEDFSAEIIDTLNIINSALPDNGDGDKDKTKT
ncbi:hypothetical protein [Flavobacterium acetivorans]|uniref:hypothetical protein n=1 Tax=Flavobacterium acetivorans TaxID=2893883 RepID=UPI001E2FE23A|nr:hypothetical protein [Flavobacterium sp. F-29]UFH34661.1 hypothetical protein LNP19_11245 [Flavobacterium sp. F-29]